jgi:DNA-binding beta-propeller fold protein YncE
VQRIFAAFITAASSAAVALLCACSSGGSQGPVSALPGSNASQRRYVDLSPTGAAIELSVRRATRMQRHGFNPAAAAKDLYVDDQGTNAIDILKNKKWTYTGDIADDQSDGNWVDKNGNIYAANYNSANITEFSQGGSLVYTYSSSIDDPVNVTVDAHGNVYDADFAGHYVNEYAQQSNAVLTTCSLGDGYVEGVAVDKRGDVFVDYLIYYSSSSNYGLIAEYKRGLNGCSGTTLGVTLGWPGGMVLDKSDNLIITDQTADTVDVIAPPYSSVTKTLASGFEDPFHVTLDKANNQAYVTENGNGEVDVLSYPGGAVEATLGATNGISYAAGAVDGRNFIP